MTTSGVLEALVSDMFVMRPLILEQIFDVQSLTDYQSGECFIFEAWLHLRTMMSLKV